jgi:hypothetical protein
VLRLFAHSLRETSREYDYVARMGGDEFVVIAPGLTPEASARKAEQMRELVCQAGMEVCGEDILSLSVGKALYPDDALEAERLLAEADRRMYLQKQSQPSRKNRRLYPRAKGRLTTEIALAEQSQSTVGIVTNLSLGGCYVETSSILLPGSQAKLTFSFDRTTVAVQGEVVRMDMGIGSALKFSEASHESRVNLQRILEQLAHSETDADKERSRNVAAGQKH